VLFLLFTVSDLFRIRRAFHNPPDDYLRNTMRYTPYIFAVTALTTSVSAALYPTQPVADTVYSPGQLALVTWIDDGQKPHLKDMGPVKLDLYHGKHVSFID
jgi:hypothetical protein